MSGFTPVDTSDIDFAVMGVQDVGLLKEHIERIPTLKRIDVIDYDRCINSLLKEVIEHEGRKIY